MKPRRFKKSLCLLLALVMCLTLLPAAVFAEDSTEPAETEMTAAAESSTEAASEPPTEAATEVASEPPTEAATEAASEPPTEAATEAASEPPTEASAEERQEQEEDLAQKALQTAAGEVVLDIRFLNENGQMISVWPSHVGTSIVVEMTDGTAVYTAAFSADQMRVTTKAPLKDSRGKRIPYALKLSTDNGWNSDPDIRKYEFSFQESKLGYAVTLKRKPFVKVKSNIQWQDEKGNPIRWPVNVEQKVTVWLAKPDQSCLPYSFSPGSTSGVISFPLYDDNGNRVPYTLYPGKDNDPDLKQYLFSYQENTEGYDVIFRKKALVAGTLTFQDEEGNETGWPENLTKEIGLRLIKKDGSNCLFAFEPQKTSAVGGFFLLDDDGKRIPYTLDREYPNERALEQYSFSYSESSDGFNVIFRKKSKVEVAIQWQSQNGNPIDWPENESDQFNLRLRDDQGKVVGLVYLKKTNPVYEVPCHLQDNYAKRISYEVSPLSPDDPILKNYIFSCKETSSGYQVTMKRKPEATTRIDVRWMDENLNKMDWPQDIQGEITLNMTLNREKIALQFSEAKPSAVALTPMFDSADKRVEWTIEPDLEKTPGLKDYIFKYWKTSFGYQASFTRISKETVLEINEKNFPDPQFRKFLKTIPGGEDGGFTAYELSQIKTMDCSRKYIKDLTGIEHFTELTALFINSNEIASVDLSKNTKIAILWAYGNPLTGLDVTMLPALEELLISNTELTALDLTHNPKMLKLDCSENQLTNLDLSKNTELREVKCSGNRRKLTEGTALTDLPGFDASKVSNVKGGNFDGGEVHFTAKELTYTYDCGQDRKADFILERAEEEKVKTVPMYRLYNPYTYEHLLSSDETEKANLIKAGWHLDGIAWNSVTEGTEVFRLYNPFDQSHLYTLNKTEIQNCLKAGWKMDGRICYSATKEDGIPIFRLFNPYASAHYHLYTISQEEINLLTSKGWRLEGVAWYAAK